MSQIGPGYLAIRRDARVLMVARSCAPRFRFRRRQARWSAAVPGKPREAYCAFIRNPTRWGGQVELSVLAEHYRAELAR